MGKITNGSETGKNAEEWLKENNGTVLNSWLNNKYSIGKAFSSKAKEQYEKANNDVKLKYYAKCYRELREDKVINYKWKSDCKIDRISINHAWLQTMDKEWDVEANIRIGVIIKHIFRVEVITGNFLIKKSNEEELEIPIVSYTDVNASLKFDNNGKNIGYQFSWNEKFE